MTEKKNHPDRAKEAGNIFMNVSGNAAGTIIGQAARIALMCQETGIDPVKYKRALLRNSEQIRRTLEGANNAHIRAIQSGGDAQRIPTGPITNQSLRLIIIADFTWAPK